MSIYTSSELIEIDAQSRGFDATVKTVERVARLLRQSSDLAETDYSRVAQAFGCTGIRVESPDQLAPALQRALVTAGRS